MSTWNAIYPAVREAGITREHALKFACPRCGAQAGWSCIGRRKPAQPRKAPHAERYQAALEKRGRQ